MKDKPHHKYKSIYMNQEEQYIVAEVTSNLMGEIVTSFDIEDEISTIISMEYGTAEGIDNKRVFDKVYDTLNNEGLVDETLDENWDEDED